MNIQLLGDRILAEILETKDKTKEGIIIPDTAKEKPQKAKVIAIGKVDAVKVNDEILFCKFTGTEITIEDKKCLILKEEDILAIIK